MTKKNDAGIVAQLKQARAAYADNVKAIAESGYFRSSADALHFFDNHVRKLWCSELGLPEDSDLIGSMRITDTMLRMIRLLASLQHDQWGKAPRKRPRHLGVPLVSTDGMGNRCIAFSRAIPKGDIATMIGRSLAAVDEALKRFRGRGKTDDFYQRQLAVVLSVETGIFLDALLSRQLQFEFMTHHLLDAGEYEHAKAYAYVHRITGGETWTRQIEHAERARRSVNAAQGVATLKTAFQNAKEGAALAKAGPQPEQTVLGLMGS